MHDIQFIQNLAVIMLIAVFTLLTAALWSRFVQLYAELQIAHKETLETESVVEESLQRRLHQLNA